MKIKVLPKIAVSSLVLMFVIIAVLLQIIQKEKILAGCSLSEMKYEIIVPEDSKYGDKIREQYYSLNLDNSNFFEKALANTYTVPTVYLMYINGGDPYPFMYLQAFKSRSLLGNPQIQLKESTIPLKNLKQYIIYLDKDITVFDFFPYLSSVNIEQQLINDIKKLDIKSIEDYRYLFDIIDYFKENIPNYIRKRQI